MQQMGLCLNGWFVDNFLKAGGLTAGLGVFGLESSTTGVRAIITSRKLGNNSLNKPVLIFHKIKLLRKHQLSCQQSVSWRMASGAVVWA